MNKHIIKEYNNIVGKDDICYILGDISLNCSKGETKEIIQRLNGTKILIAGNHDNLSVYDYYDIGFNAVHGHLKIKYKNQDIYIAHDPAWAQKENTLWFCGHVHGIFQKIRSLNNTTIINVCVDAWDYKPQSIEYLLDFSEGIEEISNINQTNFPFRNSKRFKYIDYFEETNLN
ncbi:MAG: hypothetical protein PHT94_00785 [Candidatus Nanoarchaeia archaeon]|nr:hypothetical protein [Candidatus Nanoarchaeia archaeon]